MDYMKVANSPLMWIIAGSAVSMVLIQALIFTKRALKTAKEIGVEREQIKRAVKASTISSIGPSLAIVGGMLTLLVSLGGAISWIRLGLIGSVGYELMAAGFGASAVGTYIGSPDFSPIAFSNAVLAMSFGTVGYLLITIFFTNKLETFRNKMAGGKEALVPIISAAAMIGAFSYLTVDQVFTYDIKKIVSVIVGFVIMLFIGMVEKKKKVTWTKEWGITIAMFTGMFVAMLFN